ncbi:hypothetical protein HID58_023902 [Brassica napus]|uniref:RRM domain-containing protein n=1 Tax=Brassica napus TaxID=3708 RepID=A0ABQ8D3G2_BRANA|nr:hypothetical protein HID58_023902 [Brassica napus]
MSEEVEYRCFIGGLAWSTSDRGLRDAFEKYGHLLEAKKAMDEAIAAMNGMDLDGRTITVDKAQPLQGGYSSKDDRYSAKDDRYGAKEDRYGRDGGRDRYGPDRNGDRSGGRSRDGGSRGGPGGERHSRAPYDRPRTGGFH